MGKGLFLGKKVLVPGKDFQIKRPGVDFPIPDLTPGPVALRIPPETKKILIGVPIGRPMATLPLECFVNLIAHLARDPKYIVATKFTTSAYLDSNRNELAKQAIKGKSDYLLMIDSDMTYPGTVLDTLISRDKDIIGVVYYSPRSNEEKKTRWVGPILYDYHPKKKLWMEWPECDKKEPFRVCGIGTGIMLIKTKVFDKVEQPWFSFFTAKYRKNVGIMGEDIAFCLRCMAAGVRIWADPTMNIGHCKDYTYTKKDCVSTNEKG